MIFFNICREAEVARASPECDHAGSDDVHRQKSGAEGTESDPGKYRQQDEQKVGWTEPQSAHGITAVSGLSKFPANNGSIEGYWFVYSG